MTHRLGLVFLITSLLWFGAWSTLTAVAAGPISSNSPATETDQPGIWTHYSVENAVVNALAIEGNYVWAATNGDGVIRWNHTDGSFVRYNTATGLVHNTVRAIIVDGNGHKWFGTEGGVSEFDGQTWTTYTTTHGLANNKVLDMAIDQAGRHWFATWGGVSEFDGQQWRLHTRAGGLPSNHVYAVTIDEAGNPWVATPNGIAQFREQRWTTYNSTDGLAHNWVHDIAVDIDGNLWFATPGGVTRLGLNEEGEAQQWTTFTTVDGLVSNYVHALTVDEAGNIWLATPDGISRYDGQNWHSCSPANRLPRNRITAIAVDPDGQPWLGSVDGVFGFAGHTWQHFTTGSLAGNQVNAMALDRQGHKWFATNAGVSEFDGQIWTTYTTTHGLADNQVNDMVIDAETGLLWFATDKGVSTFDGRRWTTYTTTHGLADDQVKSIGVDETGRRWVATDNGFSRFDGQRWHSYTNTQNLAISWSKTTPAVDKAGREWSAILQGGIKVSDHGNVITYTEADGLLNDLVATIAIDQSGHKWIGHYYDGISKFDDQDWTTFTTVDGLPRGRVDLIMIDEANHKWFGLAGAGVVEFDDISSPVTVQTPPPATPLLVTSSSTPSSTPAPRSDAFPKLLAEISLAPAKKKLEQAVLDQTSDRLYVRDDTGHLYVIDTRKFTRLATFEVSGNNFVLDPANQRLYAYSWYRGPVTVLDTVALTLTGTISPGGEVTLDSARNQIYAGQKVYDGATLQPVRDWPWWYGAYNPLRDEFTLNSLSAWGIDRQTQHYTQDLFPDFTAQDCYDCGGTSAVDSLYVFPAQNLLVGQSYVNSPGHGGAPRPDRFFDATTLDELTDLTGIPAVEYGCGEVNLSRPINGRIYREDTYSWFSNYYNLLVYGPNGELETWRDGIDLGITNPNMAQMYYGGNVIDLATLSPLGSIPVDCVLHLDLENGRLYARRGGDLLVFSERGGQPEVLPSSDPLGPLPEDYIGAIKISPNYAVDQTIFAIVGGKLFRSTDGGLKWRRLRGGLPQEAFLSIDLSPNFAQDHTLFAGVDYGYGRGAGVYRSTDGGDTWQAFWEGLTHLRVTGVVVSPNYAEDGTLLAYARYNHAIPSGREGGSVFRSLNRSLSWTLVITGDGMYPDLPVPEELLPGNALSSVRFRPIENGVERTTDRGDTWQPLTISRQPKFKVLAILQSPDFSVDETLYVLALEALYRSTDGGDTWAQGLDTSFDISTYNPVNAISPRLQDGRQLLFFGTVGGIFLTVDPAKIKWQPVTSAAE